ncbi:hypothetical protein ABE65_006550 [Fictibacillus phosphorivorans]|uniref:DUF4349 domain-containing protein n=1 Tax=Fictibacillus phosphorivorans TaxID=1221500 RepID=A0A160IKS7_9BACL|nr:DUF4349 domain-containing protein [Fictibacillus phosphorivorans]ANC76477.1 hypothetical protein ABE65_006550 [Fictibacillus phosphorivorans]
MWKRWKLWVFIAALLLSACSNDSSSKSDKAVDQDSGSKSEAKMDSSTEESKSAESEKGKEAQQMKSERKVIYHADMEITVDTLQTSMESVRKKVEILGGYMVESNTSTGEKDYQSGVMVVRVPMKSFRPFLDDVRSLSKGTPQENIRGEDVTEEYVDLSSRLKAKQQVRERLEAFMKNAQKTEDLLKISGDLAAVQEEIEQVEGRLNFLQNQSDYSTVTIQFEVKNLKAEELQTEGLNTWAKTKVLFMDTVNFLMSALSFVVVSLLGLAPIWVIVAIVVYVWWLKRKKEQKKKPESPTTLT